VGTTGAEVTVTPLNAAPRTLRDVTFDARVSRQDQGVSLDLTRFAGHDEPSGVDIKSLSGSFERSFDRINAAFDLERGPARATGRVEGDKVDGTRQLTSVVDLTKLDLAPFFGEQLKSDITGRTTVRAEIPPTGQTSLAFSFVGPHAAAMGYEGRDLDLTGTLEQGTVAFAGSRASL
jgi:hypothetical protein